jgi:hypothetical protein
MKQQNMKILLRSLMVAAAIPILPVLGGDAPANKPASAAFDRMKTLVGTWSGKADIGQGPINMTVQFRLLAGGTVLEERVFPGTPQEMVTMYYEKGGKLALTHYCVFGNQPAMFLAGSDKKSITFDFDKSCAINPATESHMHGLKIVFENPDTVVTSCRAFIDGKEAPERPTTLKRVK